MAVAESAAPSIKGAQWILEFVDMGWDSDRSRGYAMAYHQDQMLQRDPFMRQFARVAGSLKTRCPEQLMELRRWELSAAFNDYFRAAGLGPGLHSEQAVDGGLFSAFSFFRPANAPLFGRRERRLVHLFHREIGPLIGRVLASARDPAVSDLAPRLRQTLDCLLEGDSEKQAAARLGLSHATVHEYVGRLYRHFGVSSRAELLAYFLRRFRGGP